MKNLFLIAALALMPWVTNAQNSNSKFTITPRIGMTVSDWKSHTNLTHPVKVF